tara:strand:+ start:444 stop:992 length:549 start_codon:yes stop_codon:yes gene_type:complete
MTNIIKIKRSETADSIPTTSDLAVGELCMNIADQKLYTRRSDNTIVTVSETITGKTGLELMSDDTSSTAGPVLDLYRNSFSPFDSDAIGEIKFQGENDNSDKKVFAKIISNIIDASASTEDGSIEFHVIEDGSNTTVIKIKGDGIHITSGNSITFGDGTSMSTAPVAGATSGFAVAMSIALG